MYQGYVDKIRVFTTSVSDVVSEIDNREFFSTYNPQEYVGGGFSSPNMLHTPVKPINITNRSALEAYYKRQGLLQ